MDTQSVHAVIYNDDLLIEILLLLPVISVLQFKSVCKRWLSLISNPNFSLRRSQIPTLDPPCGALIQSLGESYFISFSFRIQCKSFVFRNPFTFGSGELHDARILDSCNGLLLLRCRNTKANKYYICNPCINLLKMVLQCSNKTIYGSRIAFDPTKSPHYKVIHAVSDDMHSVQIQIYFSETGIWTVCTGRYPGHNFYCFDDGIYWNDALYWLNHRDVSLVFKFDINVEHQTLTTIKTPRALDGHLYLHLKLFETCGCLLLLCMKDSNTMLMDFYEMRKGYSQWLLKYHVNLNDDVSNTRRSWTYPSVISIVLGEREEDSYILIKENLKIYQYKPLLKTCHELYYLESANYYSQSFQFIASFVGVGL